MIDLTKVKPGLKILIEKFQTGCLALKIDILIYSGYRSKEQQAATWQQGRFSLETVNSARVKSGLKAITEQDNKRIVTNAKAGRSKHEIGEAFDCVIMLNGVPDWGATAIQSWQKVGELAESLGLVWGRRFKSRDWVHFELKK